jgi:heme/copper-type cytochrome/quinol oxidase subunit 3
MLRMIGAVVAGYLAMAVLVFCLLTAAYLTMGTDAAFRPGSYDVSTTWLAASLPLSFVAAVAGGYVAAMLAKRRWRKAAVALAALVLVLGIVSAVMEANKPDAPAARTGDVPNMQAMMSARQPFWVCLVMPLIGVAGTLVGARLRGRGLAGASVAQAVSGD